VPVAVQVPEDTTTRRRREHAAAGAAAIVWGRAPTRRTGGLERPRAAEYRRDRGQW